MSLKIQQIVARIKFDEIDKEYGLFSEKDTVKALTFENAIPNAQDILPEDYKWYLENRGDTCARDVEYQVTLDSDTSLILSFSGLIGPQFACQNYRYETCSGSYAYKLEEKSEDGYFVLDTKFLPIASGMGNSMLLMDIKKNIGSIWQLPAKNDCDEYNLSYAPTFIASSLTAFLKMLKLSYSIKNSLLKAGYKEINECSGLWKKNALTRKEVFYQCLSEYEKTSELDYTTFKDTKNFLTILTENPETIVLHEARTLELSYRSFAGHWEAKDSKEFLEKIELLKNTQDNINKKRENASIKKLKQYTNTEFNYIGIDHEFYKAVVKSTISGLKCKEKFVFYKSPDSSQLSLLKRVSIKIEDIIIKGIGTFVYDSTYDWWQIKRRKKPKWSIISAEIIITGDENIFTKENINFIKKGLNKESLKDRIEQIIFKQYQTIDYPEFLEMDGDDKEYFKDFYPVIKSSEYIWQLLGKSLRIYFSDTQSFYIQFEYLPDEEHGLTITVNEGELKFGH